MFPLFSYPFSVSRHLQFPFPLPRAFPLTLTCPPPPPPFPSRLPLLPSALFGIFPTCAFASIDPLLSLIRFFFLPSLISPSYPVPSCLPPILRPPCSCPPLPPSFTHLFPHFCSLLFPSQLSFPFSLFFLILSLLFAATLPSFRLPLSPPIPPVLFPFHLSTLLSHSPSRSSPPVIPFLFITSCATLPSPLVPFLR